jgi:hypothetical protein
MVIVGYELNEKSKDRVDLFLLPYHIMWSDIFVTKPQIPSPINNNYMITSYPLFENLL